MLRAGLIALLLCTVAAVSASAQCLPPLLPPEEAPRCEESYPPWTGEVAALGANALLGGISAGVVHRLRGGSFGPAFLKGLAGGAVIFGGKRVSVERFGGAGLLGRQVAAVGGSMIHNAAAGRGVIEEIVLPVGPAWVYLRGSAPHARVRVDLVSTGWLLWALQEDELRLDPGMSLSAGTPVFLTENRIILANGDSTHAGGVARPGVILISDVPAFGREFARRTFEHERVHVLQMDQLFLSVTNPAEDAVLLRLPVLRRAEPYVDINLSGRLLSLLGGWTPKHLNRPWETEAIWFSR